MKMLAKEIVADLESLYPDDAESKLGELVVELANERARMAARDAELKTLFLEEKRAELKAFGVARKAEAERIAALPVPKA